MPLPTSIADLSQTAASNSPAGSESPSLIDDYFQVYAAYIAQLRDGNGFLTAVRSNSLGSVSVPAFGFVGDTNTGMWSPAADTLAWSTNGTERVRIDSSGNVGIGVTPSAWGFAYKAVQLFFGSGPFSSNAGATGLSGNCFNDGTNWVYASSNPATRYELGTDGGNHRWFIAPSGTVGNAITFTERMRLDQNGNLGIGTTSATVPCDVNGAVRTRSVTVATLPAAATAGSGARHFVTDSNSTTFAAIVAGGGGNGVPVYSDGTNWRIG